jgi:hypothetical protein
MLMRRREMGPSLPTSPQSRGGFKRVDRVTVDSHAFPTRRYDLVKEFVIALACVSLLTVALAAAFSSPDEPAISLQAWGTAAPFDVVATATAELAGTSASATYGPPYNRAAEGQKIGPLPVQKWGGVRLPMTSSDLVLGPLAGVAGDSHVSSALRTWMSAAPSQQSRWANAYATALGNAAGGDPSKVAAGNYGPVPALTNAFLTLARYGGLEGALTSSGNFYGGDPTRTLLLLSDGAYLEDQARAQHLGGDQWGMTNETGNYPGQPWMWLYTFWYQVPPFSTSENADSLVWALMMLLTLLLMFVPFIPGLRSIPRWIPIHRLIWRRYYTEHQRS